MDKMRRKIPYLILRGGPYDGLITHERSSLGCYREIDELYHLTYKHCDVMFEGKKVKAVICKYIGTFLL